jgi:transcriptional regulator with XRE-family HTH domain
MSYGGGIAWARKERGLSQEQFAREMGVKRYIVSAIETGQREPSELFIKMACSVLEIDEEDLV